MNESNGSRHTITINDPPFLGLRKIGRFGRRSNGNPPVAMSNDSQQDPPYIPVSPTANFTKYTTNGFNSQDQKELSEVFRKLDERNCKILLTNSDTTLVEEL